MVCRKWRGEQVSGMDPRHQLCWLDSDGAGDLTKVTMWAMLVMHAHSYRAIVRRRQTPVQPDTSAHQLKLFVRRQGGRT